MSSKPCPEEHKALKSVPTSLTKVSDCMKFHKDASTCEKSYEEMRGFAIKCIHAAGYCFTSGAVYKI
jgi:hypothetical protein